MAPYVVVSNFPDRPVKTPDLFDGTYKAALFDMDGVLTDTAVTHASAWKATFDEVLERHARTKNIEFVPFDAETDYRLYVDGKARASGVRDFFASRDITLDEGDPDDAPNQETVNGVGNRKNELLVKVIAENGVEVYKTSVELASRLKSVGIKLGVVSSSANTATVLKTVGITDLFDTRVDGVVAAEMQLPGKPAPDTFLEAAQRLGVTPRETIVFEDALAGVAAGRAGKFGLVVGVNRLAQRKALLDSGADVVVDDLGELIMPGDTTK